MSEARVDRLDEQLRQRGGYYPGSMPALARELAREVSRCHARLEIDYCFVDLSEERKEIPYAERLTFPDGISCRDDTIRLQEQEISRLQSELSARTAAGGEIAPVFWGYADESW